MLVLSRKQNQAIVIDGSIRVTIVAIRGNQVRLGIQAPDSVSIFREELLEAFESVPAEGDLAPVGAPDTNAAAKPVAETEPVRPLGQRHGVTRRARAFSDVEARPIRGPQ